MSVDDALAQLCKDMMDLKYDTFGYLLTPKGKIDTTQDALTVFMSRLPPDDVLVKPLSGAVKNSPTNRCWPIPDRQGNEALLQTAADTVCSSPAGRFRETGGIYRERTKTRLYQEG